MTQIKEPVATPPVAPKGKTYPCDWSNCKADHPSKLKYPGGGNVTRGGGLRGELEAKGREPWNKGGFGVGTKPIYVKSGKIKKAAGGSDFKEYRLEAHHLIPIEEVDKMGTLKSNAILAGWDIDALVNGIFLPRDVMDIAIHELQRHRGSHCGKYTGPIGDELREIEKAWENMCHGKTDTSAQEEITLELHSLSLLAQQKLLGIRGQTRGQYWELHTTSVLQFKIALKEYARRKALNESIT